MTIAPGAFGYREMYGAQETNAAPGVDWNVDHSRYVDFADKNLVKIVRLRLLSEPGYPYWDISYCYGEMVDGSRVHVNLPVYNFKRGNLSRQLVEMAKEAGRYAKGMGLLDAVSTLH